VLTTKPTSTSTTNVAVCVSALPYVWNTTSYTIGGTYTYTSTNSVGCDSVARLVLTVNPNPTVTVNNVSGCNGGIITATVNGGLAPIPTLGYTYSWTEPGAVIPSSSIGNSPSFTAVIPGTYTVVVTNNETGCKGTGSGSYTQLPCAHVFPTGTTCCNYLYGPTSVFQLLQACTKMRTGTTGLITNAIPGVFFYYADYTAATTGAVTIKIKQTRNCASNILRPFNPQNLANLRVNGADNCSSISPSSKSIGTGSELGNITMTFNAVAGKKYVISVKYDMKSIVGSAAPSGVVKYTFDMLANGSATPVTGQTGEIDVVLNCTDETPAASGDCPGGVTTTTTTTAKPATIEEKGLSVIAFPNPYHDKVNFQFVSPNSGKAVLEVYDAMGRKLGVVYTGNVEAGVSKTAQINILRTNKSMLFYKLMVGDKTVKGTVLPE
jgi:hypothetical protein